jgi:hypothetical protein
MKMIKYAVAAFIACGSLLSIPAQAAPVSSLSGIQSQVFGDALQVRHCRYWSGGWGCGYYGGYHGYHRYHHRRYWR